MADLLDVDALAADRQRYQHLLEQAEAEVAAWSARADHLQQAVDGLQRLIATLGPTSAVAPPAAAPATPVARPVAARAAPARAGAAAPAKAARRAKAAPAPRPAKAAKPTAVKAPAAPPPPTATPTAPPPVPGGGLDPAPAATVAMAEGPKGTDAIRLVLEAEPGRPMTLAELLVALGQRGWLPASKRPEEGVRISLKRLAEKGGAVRTDDGRWRLPDPEPAPPSETTQQPAEAPPTEPSEDATPEPPAAAAPAPPVLGAPPVGGAVHEHREAYPPPRR